MLIALYVYLAIGFVFGVSLAISNHIRKVPAAPFPATVILTESPKRKPSASAVGGIFGRRSDLQE